MFSRSSGKIDLPSMPTALARIIQITNSPDANSEQLAKVVSLDQSLSTKVLRLANSAFVGRRVKVATITDAVVTLGFGSIRNLAASASVIDALFPKRMFNGFSWKDMWIHSVTCAVASEVIYNRMVGGSGEFAFVAGLLHDVGKLVMARALPQRFVQVIEACQEYNFEMTRAENNILGTTHYKVGADLANQWCFPDTLAAGIAYHHNPEEAGDYEVVARAVSAGNLVAKRMSRNYLTGIPVEISNKEVADVAELSPDDIPMLIELMRPRLTQCKDIIAWGENMPDNQKAA